MIKLLTKSIFVLLIFSSVPLWAQMNYQVSSIEFRGNDSIESAVLVEQVNTRAMNLKEKVLFWKETPRFSSVILENDVERLKSYYQRHGFLYASVSRELESNEKKERVKVIITIDEGKPVILSDYSIREISNGKNTGLAEKMRHQLPLKGNVRFEDSRIYSAMQYIQRTYSNEGYPFVRVDKEVQVNTAAHSASVTFLAYPGKKAQIGKIQFEGDSLIPEKFLRKKLTFQKGDLYSHQQIEQSQENLFETGLFKSAIIRAQRDSMRNSTLPVLIRVREQPAWSFEGGVGYGTEDRFRISGELIKRHFLGGARKFILEAKRSYYLPFSVDAKFIQPNLFNNEIDFVLNPFYLREREESYEVDRLGTNLTIQKDFSRSFSSYVSYTLEQDNLLDKTLTTLDSLPLRRKLIHNKSGITLGLNRNTTDNIFDPTSGSRIEGYFTYMGLAFKSRFHYYKIGLEARHYERLAPGFILAGKIHAGVINSLSGSDATPIEDRFLIGGATSLRGWSRNSISPENEEGKAIGGNSMLQSSLELRFPIYEILSGTVFLDAGNVWRESMAYDLTDLFYNGGVGVRVQTPIGPIRADVAFPFFTGNYTPQFFISLGHAF